MLRSHAAALVVLLVCYSAIQVQSFAGFTPAQVSLLGRSSRGLFGGVGRSDCRGTTSATMRMESGEEGVSRRSVLVGLALAPFAPSILIPSPVAAEGEGPEEVVVKGEMRFEEGTDKKLAKVGGKGTCIVTLRIVGKGIISEVKFDVEASQFPPPGKPAKGQEVGGGVPFVVKVKDLREKTEKGRTVNRELWGDDDIFVRVDIKDGKGQKIASGLGKSKYAPDGTHGTSFVLLE